jgi:hypothetical protein
VALFSQDDLGEDNERSSSPDFSGSEPVDPDDERETPSPVEADETSETPEVAQPDDANAYAQSPDDQEQTESSDEPLPGGQDNGGAAEYAASSATAAAQDPGSGGAQLPSMPQYVDNLPNYQALEKEIANFKPSDYKPSIGRRIAAALSGGAVAFGNRNPAEGLRVAQSVNDAPLNRARAAEQQTEQGTRQTIADVNAQNQTRQAVYQNQRQAANDAALNEQRQQRAQDFASQADARAKAPVGFVPDDKDNPYAGGTVTLANGQTVKGPPPDKWLTQWERDPANKARAQANAGVQTLRALEASGVHLTPEQRAIVASGGKITPTVHTNINIRENPDGTPVTPKSQSMTQAQKDVILHEKNSAMNNAQQQMGAGTMTREDAVKQMQAAQDTYEQQLGVDTNGPDHMTVGPDFKWSRGGQPASASQQPAAQQPQTVQYKGQTLKMGQQIMIDGKPATFGGIGPNGKIIANPAPGAQ